MVLGLEYLKDLYLYWNGRGGESHQEKMDLLGIPSQETLDFWSSKVRWYRKRQEMEFGRDSKCHIPFFGELACESRRTFANYLQFKKSFKV